MAIGILSLAAAATAGGCRSLLGPLLYATNADKTETVQPEYADLAGKRVCVWVWADDSVAFDYPAIRLDVARHAEYFISQFIKCTFVDPGEVEKFRRSNYEADRTPVVKIGQHWNADVVLFIQVVEFTTHPTGMPNLLQGRLASQCALYDCRGSLPESSPERLLWSGRVDVTYPESRAQSSAMTSARAVRSDTLKVFGDTLAKKFYRHQRPIKE